MAAICGKPATGQRSVYRLDTFGKKTQREDLVDDGSVRVKWISVSRILGSGMDTGPFMKIWIQKIGKFLGQVNNYQILDRDSIPCTSLFTYIDVSEYFTCT